jgi:hypothetical protein
MKQTKYIFSLFILLMSFFVSADIFAADPRLMDGIPNNYLLYGFLGGMILLLTLAILSLVYAFFANASNLLKSTKR